MEFHEIALIFQLGNDPQTDILLQRTIPNQPMTTSNDQLISTLISDLLDDC